MQIQKSNPLDLTAFVSARTRNEGEKSESEEDTRSGTTQYAIM